MSRNMRELPPFEGFDRPSYTQVPDQLFDTLMPGLADAELRVLLYIIRRTFGFKRDADSISLSQMVSGITTRDGRVLDLGTGLSKATVARGLKGLRDKQIIVAERRSSRERGHEPTSYRLRFKADTSNSPPLSHSQDKGQADPVSPARQAMSQSRDTQQTALRKTDFEYSKEKTLVDNTKMATPVHDGLSRTQGDQTGSSLSEQRVGSFLHLRVRRDANGQDRSAIAAVMERFAAELADKAELKHSVSRAINLYQASGVAKDGFIDVLFEARGEVVDRRKHPGKAPLPRNQMAYFFAVVEDRLGLKESMA